MGINDMSGAVVNLKGLYRNEVDQMVDHFETLGVPTRQCDARDLRLRHGFLYNADDLVTLTYNKFDPLMFIEEPDVFDYLKAIQHNAVCSVNPLVSQLITEDKSILAFLSDPQHAHYFTEEERSIIYRHVPWTRIFTAQRTTNPQGEIIDLLEYVSESQASLVLKPANLTRGEGVVIGPEVNRAEWQQAMKVGLANSYIVQEWLQLPEIEVLWPDRTSTTSMYYGLDFYLFGGRLVGFQSRACDKSIINVGQGGCLLPVLIADKITTTRWR
jgi:diaminobutyrate-2-oxoglutarate transaminase